MKNIFKEYKKLKLENNKLIIKINGLQKENTDELLRTQEYYEKIMNKKIEFLESKYKTKIERKQEIMKLCEKFEEKISQSLSPLLDIDVTDDVNSYIKLLEFLREE